MKLISWFSKRIQTSLLDDYERRYFLFVCIYALLSLVSGAMTVANILTHKGMLTVSTAVYAVFCALIFALLLTNRIKLKLSQAAFVVSFYLLLTYFIISGNPDGFSILWVSLLPACGLLAFGRRTGTLICLGMLLELLFLLHTPLGLSIVQYDYSETFRMRFPLIYIAFYFASLLLETIRELTQNKLKETQALYQALYSHDALTGVYNRYGFNEMMDRFFQQNRQNLALIILDIDYFKNINDRFGHLQGDLVLQSVARLIQDAAGATAGVCRWGGEEFAVLIPDCANCRSVAASLCERLRANEITVETGCVSLTVSIGAVLARDTGRCSAAQLVTRADACLYLAKQSGRDRVEYDELDPVSHGDPLFSA
ncbi:MAG: GGDEF domain-containing protein [Eubacteriales bacterium]|nr:GGDEF domain-containing protein [Eubacteriales bacterium]